MCYGLVAGEIPEQQQLASRAIHSAASLRGEFPFSRNGSTATMPARLIISSSELWSDAVVRVLDVFVIQAFSSGLRSDAVSSGLRSDEVSSGLRSDAVSSGLRSDAVSSGLWSDAGDKVPVSSGLRSDAAHSRLRSDAVGKAQYVLYICIVWYVVVWGSSLSFVLTVSVLVSGTSASRGKNSGWFLVILKNEIFGSYFWVVSYSPISSNRSNNTCRVFSMTGPPYQAFIQSVPLSKTFSQSGLPSRAFSLAGPSSEPSA
ncbi:unnamed protein product [Lactuca saligna]|uniref:Uncharacterized protein n=1 Tax=Lactuca saligna TaxID=75948 RepID=A0AA35ZY43_LACSI|nr:unnamed protein product [Lactuca saligna]